MSTDDPFAGLEPQALWAHFADFTKIARPSGREGLIGDRIVAWAQARPGFVAERDKVGNVIVQVPASPGREGKPAAILQGHLDMVCKREPTAGPYDPEQGHIRVIRAKKQGGQLVDDPNGDWIRADKTTLGADDGIGVAAMLAIAEDRAAVHGPLELLFTVGEEVGFTGAYGLDPSRLRGRTYLNLDSEEEGVLTIGSAGYRETALSWSRPLAPTPAGSVGMKLSVTGLRGGHSGVNINSGRLNAVRALARVLQEAKTVGALGLVSVAGGHPANAIPSDAKADIVLPAQSEAQLRGAVEGARAVLAEQYPTEANLRVNVEALSAVPTAAFAVDDTTVLIDLLRAIPTGVIAMSQKIAMSPKMAGLVETSNNLGEVSTAGAEVTIVCSTRSSVAAALEEVTGTLVSIAELAGAKATPGQVSPGWDPQPSSPIVDLVKRAYHRLYGSDPGVAAVHAGLECGLMVTKVHGLDAVSFGPTVHEAHSTQEGVEIASVKKFYDLLAAALADFST
ncbi:MAG: beta-Ala-His dipeptidase [Isosphaeraceae bacterium]|nr:beta-Ala-His dipeptidase [Isosphaeraceae bacterium]